MRLRGFRQNDLPALHTMDQLCFRVGIAYSRSELNIYARHPAVLTLIAEDDSPGLGHLPANALAGFAMAEVVRRRKELSGHIITIDVDPGLRRRGVGRLLMKGVEAWLREQKIESCSLEVAVDDPAALNFYQQLSYLTAGKVRNYYMGTLDAWLLRKTLAE